VAAVLALVSMLVFAWLALSGLTMAGAQRRGLHWRPALVTGLFFPVTWIVWYVHDLPERSG
jgi:hypothetical protein